jgi:hypothetical protein
MAEVFGVTTPTLQKAVNFLKKDGFLASRGKYGTFVAPSPPCHRDCALAFFSHPGGPGWSWWYWAIYQEALRFSLPGGGRLKIFFDADTGLDESFQDSLYGCALRRLFKGIIFAFSPYKLIGTPLMSKDLGIPRVGYCSPFKDGYKWFKTITPDNDLFLERAFERLAGLGRKRAGSVIMPETDKNVLEKFMSIAASKGIELSPWHIQAASREVPRWASNAVQLMLKADAPSRIDGLLVGDEHLVVDALDGIQQSGLIVGKDIDVVTHCNYPVRNEFPAKVVRLGLPARDFLVKSVELIEAIKKGAKAPIVSTVNPLFKEECRD